MSATNGLSVEAGRGPAVPAGSAMPGLSAALVARMAAAGIREEDLEETFVRSSGHGGQNVNKTSTCVVLVHRPTGIQVRCQATRQQGMNRVLAREQLVEKVEGVRKARDASVRAAREKVRRQKRPRSWGSKQRMLEGKARRGLKKTMRRGVGVGE